MVPVITITPRTPALENEFVNFQLDKHIKQNTLIGNWETKRPSSHAAVNVAEPHDLRLPPLLGLFVIRRKPRSWKTGVHGKHNHTAAILRFPVHRAREPRVQEVFLHNAHLSHYRPANRTIIGHVKEGFQLDYIDPTEEPISLFRRHVRLFFTTLNTDSLTANFFHNFTYKNEWFPEFSTHRTRNTVFHRQTSILNWDQPLDRSGNICLPVPGWMRSPGSVLCSWASADRWESVKKPLK